MDNPTAGKTESAREDRRTAAGHYVTLSIAMMSVAMALLGAGAAIVAVVVDKRTPKCWFYSLSVIGVGCLVGSIISGGIGVNRVAEAGYRGNWSLVKGSTAFRVQCLLGAVGIGSFVVACLMSGPANG